MELVIPLSEYTDNDYLDLRYALRGFDLYLKPSSVYLIGARPTWIQGIEHIPAKDRPESPMRERNMFEKLLLYPGTEFLYGNDDHFLLQPWKEEYAWDMTLNQKYHTLPNTSHYKMTVANSLRLAPAGNNYDVHCPMVMHREYLHRLAKADWRLPWGFCLKSIYASAAKISGVRYPDLKIRGAFRTEAVRGRKWFSTSDGVVDKSLAAMNKLYSKKSKYEK